MNELKKERRLMRLSLALSALFMAVGLASSLGGRSEKTRFAEIDVERLNIVERDGKVRLVIANKERTPGPVERGVPFGYGSGRRIGLIFYNDEGTECGGLCFGSAREGDRYESGAILAFDQYDQDQAIALQQYESDQRRYTGLTVAEYPTELTNKQRAERYEAAGKMADGPAKTEALRRLESLEGKARAYFGRAEDGAAVVRLMDPAGKTRLRLRVDASGTPRIEFLDASGKVTKAISE